MRVTQVEKHSQQPTTIFGRVVEEEEEVFNRKPVKMREQLKLEEQEEIAVGQVTVMKPNKV